MSADQHDPGGRVRLPIPPGILGAATFSPCGRYRSGLSRRKTDILERRSGRSIVFVGLNPSTAEGNVDDPTIRRECDFAWREGFTLYVKVNICDFRATQPGVLLNLDVPPRSPAGLQAIKNAANAAARYGGLVVAAWGVVHPMLKPYADEALDVLLASGAPLRCLGYAKDGSPRHPLYLRADAPLLPFPRKAAS